MPASTNVFVKQKIDRYELQQPLGVGGMARVFVGWDSVLERPVAIKFLHDHLADDATFMERFQREAKLVATLNHPNIIQIYDYNIHNTADGRMSPYMVMPYITGKTLKELLTETCARSERLSRERILAIMLDLISALHYAHNHGMIHRDVKPSNILFDEHDHAILMDFGIARLKEVSQLTQEGAAVGTPTYMSPEQAAGGVVDSRTDLYALGVILYEMLAGRPPFDDESMVAVILSHLNTPVPDITQFDPNISPELEAVVNKALAKKPDDRYQTAYEMADDLRLALASPAQSSNITPGFVRAAQPMIVQSQAAPLALPVKRPALNRWAVGASAVVLLALVAVFVLRNPLGGTADTSQAHESGVSSMTEEEGAPFLSSFAPDDATNKLWQQTSDGNILRQITPDGFYHFENRMPSTAETALYSPTEKYRNGLITLEATLEDSSSSASGYGIVFRYRDAMNYNVFAVDGNGRFSLWALADGVWTELRGQDEKWTENQYVNPIGERNQLAVTFTENHLVGYVNQEQVVDVHVDTSSVMEGSIGVYLASTASGPASVLIDTYQVGGQVPSMTDDSH
ncbi:MAG: serine/threonine-protein kinase [Anaerolineae bacterium]